MITYGAIARAFTKTLKELFPDHKVYSIARAEDNDRPAFFFYLKPVIIEASNNRTRRNVLSLYVDYHQKVKGESGMYEAADKIREALGWKYKIPEGYINVTEFDWEFVGRKRDVMELNITLEYYDAIQTDEHADIMESVDVNYNLKEEYK